MVAEAARRKTHRSGRDPESTTARAVRTPSGNERFVLIHDEWSLKKALDLPCPFTGQDRANRIDEVPAGLDQLGGDREQAVLQADKPVEPFRRQAPPPFGIATPGAAA